MNNLREWTTPEERAQRLRDEEALYGPYADTRAHRPVKTLALKARMRGRR